MKESSRLKYIYYRLDRSASVIIFIYHHPLGPWPPPLNLVPIFASVHVASYQKAKWAAAKGYLEARAPIGNHNQSQSLLFIICHEKYLKVWKKYYLGHKIVYASISMLVYSNFLICWGNALRAHEKLGLRFVASCIIVVQGQFSIKP